MHSPARRLDVPMNNYCSIIMQLTPWLVSTTWFAWLKECTEQSIVNGPGRTGWPVQCNLYSALVLLLLLLLVMQAKSWARLQAECQNKIILYKILGKLHLSLPPRLYSDSFAFWKLLMFFCLEFKIGGRAPHSHLAHWPGASEIASLPGPAIILKSHILVARSGKQICNQTLTQLKNLVFFHVMLHL